MPKKEMSSSNDFPIRNKANMQKIVADANDGVYPGWDEGNPGREPRPLVTEKGIPSCNQLQEVQSTIQVHVLPNETWLFPHFDCYVQVCFCS